MSIIKRLKTLIQRLKLLSDPNITFVTQDERGNVVIHGSIKAYEFEYNRGLMLQIGDARSFSELCRHHSQIRSTLLNLSRIINRQLSTIDAEFIKPTKSELALDEISQELLRLQQFKRVKY